MIIRRINANEMKITVWESCFKQMDDEYLLGLNPPPVLIFAATGVRTFRDTIHSQTTSATRIYSDLEIPEVALIKSRFEGEMNQAELQQSQKPQIYSPTYKIYDVVPIIEEKETHHWISVPVMIFTGMVVKQVNDYITRTSCSATKLYVNLEIDETAMVQAIYEDIQGSVRLLPPPQ
ncbi:Nucleic acid-binding protein [Corchorus capsularis]|uniref:Nucleic acid-binding protein n=1 Tax=Corchorus capsularis TaxID=210143 RepID=A0A1R3K995_COCAP|nr:Nucleic acid-binding protein [Corchorus capsularis]